MTNAHGFDGHPVTALPDSDDLASGLRRFTAHAPTLALVVDDSPSMHVWKPTATAFHELAATVFTRVSAYELSRFRTAPDLTPPDGRLVIVLTDGLDAFWAQREAGVLLQAWGQDAPVAIVNPYPQERWHRTNLAPRLLRLQAGHAMATNAELRIREPGEWTNPFDQPLHASAVAVPLLELTPRWFEWWASLIAGPSDVWLDAVAYVADPDRSPGPARPGPATAPPPTADPRDLVFQFRAESSSLAFRLATFIASAPLDLEALRVVQGVLLPASHPVHLAEVVTSPLLVRSGPGPGAELSFRPGVREALLAFADRSQTAHVVEIVADYYGDREPAASRLLEVLADPGERPDTEVTVETLPYARLELAVLGALSGPYLARASRLRQAIAQYPAAGEPEVSVVSDVSGPPGTGSWQPPSPQTGPTAIATSINSLLRPETDAVVWGNVPPRNGDFTGREQLLEGLDRQLRDQNVAAVLPQALHGMGGVGKSQIATEYAYRHRSNFDVVWFVPSEQPSQILRALRDLGDKLDLDLGPDTHSAVRAVLHALTVGVPYSNWLLIFDNAESIDTVRPYLPQRGTGKVLITSRNENWTTDVADPLKIGVFDRTESVALLRKRNPEMAVGDASRLAEVLDDLPLAIGQAASWLATTEMPVEYYMSLLLDKRSELDELAHREDYEVAVAAAWTVALERLGQENPVALQLLQACSFMAPEPISLELFLTPPKVNISPEMDATLQNPSRLNRALRQIERYGLARTDYREQTIQLHRLVRNVVIDQLSHEEQENVRHAAHLLLAGGNPGNPGGAEQWPRFHALLPHVLASNIVDCEDEWARQLAIDIIAFFFWWGDQRGCREYAVQVVEHWNTILAPEDPQILKAARWLAYVERQLGNFAVGAAINADCLTKLQASVGHDDEETLDAMMLVSDDRRAAGNFDGAVELATEAFEISRRVFGPDYPHTLATAHSLAVSLRAAGDFRTALQRDMDTVRRRIDVLGPDHPLTLLTQNGLTLDLRECGEYVEASKQQELLYDRTQRALGAGHQITLLAARNLAVARRRAGHHATARKLAKNTMDILRTRAGELSPEAIACALNYAVDLRENDQLGESREFAERTWQEYHDTLQADHPYALYARTNLGIVLRLLGEVEAARVHDAAAYEGLRERLGDDHVLTLTCATNLASDLAAIGDHAAALALDGETLGRSERVLGPEHPSTLACSLNYAFDLMAVGRSAEGRQRFDSVVDAYRRVLGRDHPAIVAALAGERANCDVDPMPL
jgi:hypothetical protein